MHRNKRLVSLITKPAATLDAAVPIHPRPGAVRYSFTVTSTVHLRVSRRTRQNSLQMCQVVAVSVKSPTHPTARQPKLVVDGR
jgi:hypothetical protein